MTGTPRIDRRKPAAEITPEYEDSGLFKGGVVQVRLVLVPEFSTSSRSDYEVRGFTPEGHEVAVIFAGRRRAHFESLYVQLRYMFAQAKHRAATTRQEMMDVNDIQLPVLCEGAWRARTHVDEHGREKRSMQFLVARWGFQGQDGKSLTFGATSKAKPGVSQAAGSAADPSLPSFGQSAF